MLGCYSSPTDPNDALFLMPTNHYGRRRPNLAPEFSCASWRE